MEHLTSFELALVAVAAPVYVIGVVKFVWMISLGHFE